jgi:FMN phosphatase YigB (HAD superfamily)
MVRAVYFDVGETLVCENRMWALWAEYLGVASTEFNAVLEDVIVRGGHHHEALRHFRAELDIEAARLEMKARGMVYRIGHDDLYRDAMACLASLRDLGIIVGVAGNQPIESEVDLRELGLPVDIIVTLAALAVAKPDPTFFDALRDRAGVPAGEIAYVGDRLDNDVLPAQAAGMLGVLVERGPWGRVHAKSPEATKADLVVTSLEGLPAILTSLRTA